MAASKPVGSAMAGACRRVTRREAIGDTQTVTSTPAHTLFRRWLGWRASDLRRAVVVFVIGLIVAIVLLQFATPGVALIGGWDAAALAFLLTIWPIIIQADGSRTEYLATREDSTRASATIILVGASVASLLGVGFALSHAGRENGLLRGELIGLAVLTVVLSWTVVNTVYTLRYAHLHFATTAPGITFGDPAGQERPSYHDFAYVAFTIGMTYQVSDTTLRNTRLRRSVLAHAALSYVFGVVIVAGSVNLITGLVR
jgi:uncharacterized membrane protein